MVYPTRTIEERIRRSVVVDSNGCWLWTGKLFRNGYSQIAMRQENGKFKGKLAHRISYRCYVGEIPAGLVLDHLCRVPRCVNPDHLEAVTQSVNNKRGLTGKTRKPVTAERYALRTCCIRGHPFTMENTYRTKVGARCCKTCQRLWQQKFRQRAKVVHVHAI